MKVSLKLAANANGRISLVTQSDQRSKAKRILNPDHCDRKEQHQSIRKITDPDRGL